ncbi:glycosyltransferase family 2 protein [Nocardioides sp.]|uniref:glycosyltransferase family 2 protein n=1 Tax=Nocardioides sp. TaxID=35761 RepID=UPI0035151B5C
MPSTRSSSSDPAPASSAPPDLDCDLVLPCLDEAAALRRLLPLIPAGLRTIVVDNGSTDDTVAVARSLGATVVEESRPGYGAAVHAGVEAAEATYVAVMDGDGSFDPEDLLPLLAAVVAGRADLAVGRRRPVRRGIWPWHARLGNALVVRWMRWRIGMTVHDIAPMRVCRRQDLLDLGVEDRRFGYPAELLQRATTARWRCLEHDVAYHPRAEGTRSKVSGSVRGSLRAARDFRRVLA